MTQTLRTSRGTPSPLGATVYPEGVNFALFTRNASSVEVLLFDHMADGKPSQILHLDRDENRTFYYWHIFVFGLRPGQIYAYRADGPYRPEEGFRYDPAKVLLDPYAREIVYGDNWARQQATRPGDNCASAMKCVVIDSSAYDWLGDRPLQHSFNETVIYEMHVGGFTRHPSSGVRYPGTYLGVIDKIPYLRSLGITAVELLPVQQFDEQDIDQAARSAGGTCVSNYWGYNPVSFFAPHRGYCTSTEAGQVIQEFRDMVRALHQADIEVIIDVVFNHTAEGDHLGPTICYRGLENRAYYQLDPSDHSRYLDYTGCGNTVNGNHSIVRRLIVDALHCWVQDMHVDGFRFDLASALSRDELGQPMRSPPILWDIESDPCLASTKIIAEAWDAAGLYQVGTFIGHRWAEWNARYRDDVRRFIRGDDGTISSFAARLIGSPDIYKTPDHALHRSINFVTCHDGLTLNDLVSYNQKRNAANGENNQDGIDENFSWNCGHEGPTDDPSIERLRQQQIRNALAILMVAQGTPMLLSGDEVCRTQQGNNNAYCQDNDISWLNWQDLDRHSGLQRFTQRMIELNRHHPALNLEMYADFTPVTPRAQGGASDLSHEQLTWHGIKLNEPDWGYYSHSIALEIRGNSRDDDLYLAFNAYWEDLVFELPPRAETQPWRLVVDTSQPSPGDIADPGHEPSIAGHTYQVHARSVVILTAPRGSDRAAGDPHQ